jgi:uncharacterized membrane protein
MLRKILKIALISLGFLVSILGIAMAWLLRDGMGPDAIESHGWLALQRIVEQSVGLVVVGAILIALGWVIPKSAHNKSMQPTPYRGG